MDRCDFTFRGESLSNRGYMLCEFDGSGSVENVTTDSQREFTSISMFGGRYFPIIYSVYDGAFVAEMSICKSGENVGAEIKPKESAALKRWLESPIASEFRIGGNDYEGIFWNGTFNVEEIHSDDVCVGFHLTFTATAPFGYKDKVAFSGSVSKDGSISIDDTSDDEGYIYPDITVTLKAAGDLKITNNFDKRTTVVRGCSSGETLTFTHLLQILSSNKSHELGDDFNYKFIRINNEYGNVVNKLTFNLPCTYSISYNPIAKVVIA
ncbi:hypothetical protein DWV75_03550 [Ruminococcus sp. AF12-5]|nr:hypothetical protein DWV75_03550 [Ruminococcus sp. AF12-5]